MQLKDLGVENKVFLSVALACSEAVSSSTLRKTLFSTPEH
jgi:hypothetical protein